MLSLDEQTHSLERRASVSLDDAPVSVASHGRILITAMGTGCKNLIRKRPETLVPLSSFHHDVQVSASHEQAAVTVAPSGSRLAVASDDGHLTIIQLPHYDLLTSKQLHSQGITDLSISFDGALLATTARDRAAYVCKTDSIEIVQRIRPVMPEAMRTHVRAIRFAPRDPSVLFTVESNPRKGGWVAVWRSRNQDGGNWSPVSCLKASRDAVTAFAIDSSGEFLALSSAEGHVSVFKWNATTLSQLWSTEANMLSWGPGTPPHVLPVTALAFTKSSEHLLTASADYTVAVWSTQRNRNWRLPRRVLLWFVSVLVLMFAMLLVEDEQLNIVLRETRSRITPRLEPFASEFQTRMRPLVRKGSESLRPFVQGVQKASCSRLSFLHDKAKPLSKRWEEFQGVWRALTERAQDSFDGTFKRGTRPLRGSKAIMTIKGSHSAEMLQLSKEEQAVCTTDDLRATQEPNHENLESQTSS